MTDQLEHYGILRRSGRYPWGSGENPYQRGISFQQAYKELLASGMKETDIAKAMGFESTSQLRANRSIARNEVVKAELIQIKRMRDKGMSPEAIGRQLGIPGPTVRSRLAKANKHQEDVIINTANLLKSKTGDGYLDVGEGNELYLGVSSERLKTAIEVLKNDGYHVIQVFQPQLGNPGKFTTYKVLTKDTVSKQEVYDNLDKIKQIAAFSDDGGLTFQDIKPPVKIDPNRVAVVYKENGGDTKDGLIELRSGQEDLSLGAANYAQVRIKVGDDHYLKGMAVYSDNLPDGVDIRFNTNKSDTGNKLDSMKLLESDPENPFKSTVRQLYYKDKNGKEVQSPLNIVGNNDPDGLKLPGEEGSWAKWSKNLSSQFLSKQTPALAKQQLDVSLNNKKAEFEEIQSLTNPTIKKQLLESFADSVDSQAIKMKATGLPGTMNHVILPVNTVKDNEVYAPNYKNGDVVVLVRHPHGGPFEIPQLIVNNRNKEAKAMMGTSPKDAIGINYKVAQKLSGADFDGDTVLVIPTRGQIKTAPTLKGLENFDPMIYQNKDLPPMSDANLQKQMGMITNLITDMSIHGANEDELSAAVRHSMVVIDSKKHKLDYKQSARDNGIRALTEAYQKKDDGGFGGASTLLSRSSSKVRIPKRKLRNYKDGGGPPIDPETGALVYIPTGDTHYKTGELLTAPVPRMSAVSDARDLISTRGSKIETIYANYANGLKGLANSARKEAFTTPNLKYSPSAKKTYAEEVSSLNAKLNVAMKNAPLERQAQLVGNISYNQKVSANPDLTKDDKKKLKTRELALARTRLGARKEPVNITDREWEAIQAGAISNHKLTQILQNTNMDRLKELALPRNTPTMGASMISRAKSMLARGYTQAEVAEALGVSTSTIANAIN